MSVDSPSNPTVLKIHLKYSKPDQSREGTDLYIGRTHNCLCLVVALLLYLAVRGMDQGPLFRWQDRTPLTRAVLADRLKWVLLRAGVDVSGYSGHSFRIGAATTAAANGVSDATIQLMGRWMSDSFCRYVRIPRHQLAGISRILSQN